MSNVLRLKIINTIRATLMRYLKYHAHLIILFKFFSFARSELPCNLILFSSTDIFRFCTVRLVWTRTTIPKIRIHYSCFQYVVLELGWLASSGAQPWLNHGEQSARLLSPMANDWVLGTRPLPSVNRIFYCYTKVYTWLS